MKIKLFKNVIDKEAQEKLKKLLLDQSMFPWYFIKDISGTTPSAKNQGRAGLQHIFCSKGNGVNSNHFNDILPLFNFLNWEVFNFTLGKGCKLVGKRFKYSVNKNICSDKLLLSS